MLTPDTTNDTNRATTVEREEERDKERGAERKREIEGEEKRDGGESMRARERDREREAASICYSEWCKYSDNCWTGKEIYTQKRGSKDRLHWCSFSNTIAWVV